MAMLKSQWATENTGYLERLNQPESSLNRLDIRLYIQITQSMVTGIYDLSKPMVTETGYF